MSIFLVSSFAAAFSLVWVAPWIDKGEDPTRAPASRMMPDRVDSFFIWPSFYPLTFFAFLSCMSPSTSQQPGRQEFCFAVSATKNSRIPQPSPANLALRANEPGGKSEPVLDPISWPDGIQ